MRLALYQPDIPPNTGTLLRLGACLGVPVDIIEPCGFPFRDRSFRRAGLDYLDRVECKRHVSWEAFYSALRGNQQARLILLTTKADLRYVDFQFQPDDTLMVGRETAGVDESVHRIADARICIPMIPGVRSINVATAASMVLGEAMRQIDGFSSSKAPEEERSAG